MQGNLNELLKELPPETARHIARYGVKLAIDLLQTFYADLAGERRAEPAKRTAEPAKRRGRPKASPAVPEVKAAKKGWSDDPAERSREMRRRLAVRDSKRHLHIADPRNPHHGEWVAKLRKARKKSWKSMSPAQRAMWQAKMAEGKRKAQRAKTESEAA